MKEHLQDVCAFLINKIMNGDIHAMTGMVNAILKFNEGDANVVTFCLNYLSPFAFALISVYFLVGLIEQYSRVGQELSFEPFIKTLVGLIIADVLVNSSYRLVEIFMNLSNKIGPDMMEGYFASDFSLAAQGNNDKLDVNLLSIFIITIALCFGYIISILATLIIGCLCMSTKLEIMVRLSFIQLGLANLANSNDKTAALRYLRKLLASSFYGAALCVVIIASSHIGVNASAMGLDASEVVKLSDDELAALKAEAETEAKDAIAKYSISEDDSQLDADYVEKVKANLVIRETERIYNQKLFFKAKAVNAFAATVVILTGAIFQILSPIAAIGAVSAAKSAINEAFGA